MPKSTNKNNKRGWRKGLKSQKEIHYDEGARQEYLTGFQKRNQIKKLKAKEYKQSLLKQEKLEWKREKQESLKPKKLLVEQDLKQIESLQTFKANQQNAQIRETVLDEKKITVTITEIDLDE